MMCWQKELVFLLSPELAGSVQPVNALVDRSSERKLGARRPPRDFAERRDPEGCAGFGPNIWRMLHPVGKPGVNAEAHVSFGDRWGSSH